MDIRSSGGGSSSSAFRFRLVEFVVLCDTGEDISLDWGHFVGGRTEMGGRKSWILMLMRKVHRRSHYATHRGKSVFSTCFGKNNLLPIFEGR